MSVEDGALTYNGNGVQVTSGAASATVAIPNTADGNKAKYVLLICPSGYVYVKPVITSGTATANDVPIVSTGSTQIILYVKQYTHIAYIQGSAAAPLNIIPLEY